MEHFTLILTYLLNVIFYYKVIELNCDYFLKKLDNKTNIKNNS
jgi:hypothetical protein